MVGVKSTNKIYINVILFFPEQNSCSFVTYWFFPQHPAAEQEQPMGTGVSSAPSVAVTGRNTACSPDHDFRLSVRTTGVQVRIPTLPDKPVARHTPRLRLPTLC